MTFAELIEDAGKMLELAYQDDEDHHWMMLWTSCPHYIGQALYYAARC